MSSCKMLENDISSDADNNQQDQQPKSKNEENGAGAMEEIGVDVGNSTRPIQNEVNIISKAASKFISDHVEAKSGLHMTPPPPPPSTPVQKKLISKRLVDATSLTAQLESGIIDVSSSPSENSVYDKWDDPCGAPLPPPLPKKQLIVSCVVNQDDVSFEMNLKLAKSKLKITKMIEEDKLHAVRRTFS